MHYFRLLQISTRRAKTCGKRFADTPRHSSTVIAAVDFAYLTGDTGNTGLSAEDFAEGCSYLLALHTETIGATSDGLQPYNEAAAAAGYYHESLVTSYRIRRYYQFEMRVDDHDYRATHAARTLTITPPSEKFEKALRFGYINIKQQIHNSQKGAADLKIVSYRDVAAYFLQKDLITYVPEPIPRIVMRFPIVPEFLEHFEKHLFQEEVGLLDLEGRDLFVRPELLEREQVFQSLTIGDLLKVWRVVNFMAHTFAAYLEPLLTTNRPLCQRSLVPAFTDANFHAMIGEIIGPVKAAEYIRYLALGQNRNRDLVYQPLLKAGDVWYIPMNLIAGSNFIRNILQLSERRFHGSNDPLGALLAEDFRQIGAHAWPSRHPHSSLSLAAGRPPVQPLMDVRRRVAHDWPTLRYRGPRPIVRQNRSVPMETRNSLDSSFSSSSVSRGCSLILPVLRAFNALGTRR